MIKRVLSTFQVEGFHCWPDAKGDVGFLASTHRHKFVFTVEMPVTDNNRQVEFITFGRATQGLVESNFGRPARFGAMSCEHIASWLMQVIPECSAVEVWEDNENGARVER